MSSAKARGRAKSKTERRRDELAKQVAELREFLKGSLVETQIRCGKANCKCTRDERHKALHLSYKQGGHTKRVYIPRRLAAEVEKWIGNRKKLRKLLLQIFELNLRLIKEKGKQGR